MGNTVATTLDADLQEAAYQALGDKKGAVVAMEPKTGKILAMVSKPDFDPNTVEENWNSLSSDTNSVLLNRATQGQYAPGSTFKVVTLLEYMREKQAGLAKDMQTSVTFSGLAQGGMILLPVNKNEQQILNEKRASDTRKELMNAARKGDQAAIETLTFDDMDLYSKVSKRLANEDVFSIVDTYFMPFGAECDMYSIMGEILAVRERINRMTGVRLYQMRLNVNELTFDICVPAESVMGEPEIGRRFKGTIWLQGYINF